MFAALFARVAPPLRSHRRANPTFQNRTLLSVEVFEDRALMSSTPVLPPKGPDASTIPTELVQLTLQSSQPMGPKSEWMDINGDGEIDAGETFAPVGGRLVRIGDTAADGASAPGTIRWIDVNHDGKRQGNETFLFLPGGDLMRVAVSGPSTDGWLINDLRRFGQQGNPVVPSGSTNEKWYDLHGGTAGMTIKCNGNTTTTTTKYNDGSIVECQDTKGKDGTIANSTTTCWNPCGVVTRTQETKNKDGSTTTTYTNWNADGSGSITKVTRDKDGNTVKKVAAEYDNKGDKFKQTQQEGDKTTEWNKDPKSKQWSNSDNQSAKKPPNEQKGGLPDKMPPKPAKPK